MQNVTARSAHITLNFNNNNDYYYTLLCNWLQQEEISRCAKWTRIWAWNIIKPGNYIKDEIKFYGACHLLECIISTCQLEAKNVKFAIIYCKIKMLQGTQLCTNRTSAITWRIMFEVTDRVIANVCKTSGNTTGFLFVHCL